MTIYIMCQLEWLSKKISSVVRITSTIMLVALISGLLTVNGRAAPFTMKQPQDEINIGNKSAEFSGNAFKKSILGYRMNAEPIITSKGEVLFIDYIDGGFHSIIQSEDKSYHWIRCNSVDIDEGNCRSFLSGKVHSIPPALPWGSKSITIRSFKAITGINRSDFYIAFDYRNPYTHSAATVQRYSYVNDILSSGRIFSVGSPDPLAGLIYEDGTELNWVASYSLFVNILSPDFEELSIPFYSGSNVIKVASKDDQYFILTSHSANSVTVRGYKKTSDHYGSYLVPSSFRTISLPWKKGHIANLSIWSDQLHIITTTTNSSFSWDIYTLEGELVTSSEVKPGLPDATIKNIALIRQQTDGKEQMNIIAMGSLKGYPWQGVMEKSPEEPDNNTNALVTELTGVTAIVFIAVVFCKLPKSQVSEKIINL